MRGLAILFSIFTSGAWASEPLVIRNHQEVRASQPDQQGKGLKVWTIRQTESIRINLVEMEGELSLHMHPDAAHSLMVLEGSLKVQVAEKQFVLNKGDFVSIPAKAPHKYWSLGGKTTVVSMDAPYYDPKKTVVLDHF